MLLNFFNILRDAGVPVSVRELMDLLGTLKEGVAFADADDFYALSRAVMVKDESHFDRFDKAFGYFFKGIGNLSEFREIPSEWLEQALLKEFSEEELAAIEALGGWDELMETFRKRLEEQEEQHQGGNKWIGTGGTSPFGHSGYNPEGIRIGGEGKQRKAVKVWEQRQYRNLSDEVQLGTRNIKLALRKLRRFARQGEADELDLGSTISATAKNGGMLDIKLVPQRRNAIKVLLFLDVGGSMDPFVKTCEALFSAARSEFKYLEYYYFHNFIYDYVWRDNHLRYNENILLSDILRSYGSDYRLILVGDAAMSPYEIIQPGGSIEHWNDQAGETCLKHLTSHFSKAAWINPLPREQWDGTRSVGMIRELMEDRMYPMSLEGLEECMAELR